MKKLSKILCWLLTLAMLAAMCPTVLAAEDRVVSPYYGVSGGMCKMSRAGGVLWGIFDEFDIV